ncbi:uncharacterized protein BX664DRAFT_326653 [Halteromyces radiatus]|uniref:uncharacterized protein n=1 Tax=Halteromyces radiatus TaxID=101107 RepID=UPI00221E5C2C|nr:uncharacterized protein BX664DRAFT_326653 [Halteromyces radiatus]KAI8097545.1 hypothetical protein BX664DRAFT_326653 [Halteromyces radiatus]
MDHQQEIIVSNNNDFTATYESKQRRKKTFYFQRDSLAKRNRLLVGKEGSRRRQRYDNGNFTNHPFAVLYEDDLYPPGYQDLTTAFWTRPDIASLYSDDEYLLDSSCSDGTTLSMIKHHSSIISHHVHKELKKQHIPQGIVLHYEHQLINFKEGDQSTLAWSINDPFIRFVIHIMCHYHHLESHSEHHDDRCILYINHPSYYHHHRQQQNSGYGCIQSKSFFDYLFRMS